MSVVIPVILCGGSGTRLWPLSRRNRPKQFMALVGDETLLEATLRRAGGIASSSEIICVTAAEYGAEVRYSLDRLGMRGRLLLEPEPRNTAPALAAAALVAARIHPDAILITLPADHFIEEGEAFAAAVSRACGAAAGGWITVLGVKPRHPSPGFGYIVPGPGIEGLPGVARVQHFVEKPAADVAADLIGGGALWNAGLVVARADRVVSALHTQQPELLAAVERSLPAGTSKTGDWRLESVAFADAPNLSFDYAVLEGDRDVATTALDAAWRDLGTWGEVSELYSADGEGNRHRGRVFFSSSRNSFVFSPHRLTVGIGLTDVVVVDTPDALLVARRDDLPRLREVVEEMARAAYPEVSSGDRNVPPGGENGTAFTDASAGASRIALAPGEIVRCEPRGDASRLWIVLEGSVQATVGGRASTLRANQCFRVPPGVMHTIVNPGPEAATLVEVNLAAPIL